MLFIEHKNWPFCLPNLFLFTSWSLEIAMLQLKLSTITNEAKGDSQNLIDLLIAFQFPQNTHPYTEN